MLHSGARPRRRRRRSRRSRRLGFRIKKLATASTAGTGTHGRPSRSGRFATAQADGGAHADGRRHADAAGRLLVRRRRARAAGRRPIGRCGTVTLGAADAGSIDIFSVSGGTSLAFELHDVEVIEG
jgi:hypothetical protein